MRDLVFSADIETLTQTLAAHPELASEEFSLPDNPATAHPLHRICDGVFNHAYSEDTALKLAKLFIRYGADVNYQQEVGRDSALTVACSLQCDHLALFYLEQGAQVDHRGCHGGTALHWASWCGRDVLVEALVDVHADINQRCIDFKATPLFWAIHGYKFSGENNRYRQAACARILLDHGADPSIPNAKGRLPRELIEEQDKELLQVFERD